MPATLVDAVRNEINENPQPADPWQAYLALALSGPHPIDMISTVHLCQMLGVRMTKGNTHRIALVMRALGFLPHKSRHLPPGGHRTPECRGWVRPGTGMRG